ncbi:MAG: GAF domain-containing protein [Flavobacteriaceae bacterium]
MLIFGDKLFPLTSTALQTQVEHLLSEDRSVREQLQAICELLQKEVAHYDWVGFYFADARQRKLFLKAFAGKPTDHTEIPFGKGICGQVAESNQNFVVPDVQAQDNYISCSIDVKSEIVIPIFVDGENIGQIDIDSNTLDPFRTEDEQLLEHVCALVATQLKNTNTNPLEL